MPPSRLLRAIAIVAVLAMGRAAHAETPAGLDKVSFGTNWVAQAEHGGFYQAVADGTYARYGLDVKIVPGGPNVNNRIQLIAGKLDFFMSANTLQSFDAVANNVPVIAVAAIFQKDPQVFLAHPSSKVTKLEDLKPLTLFVSKEGMPTYFQWLKSEYGFSEDKVKPYTSNAQPFLADKNSAMQGYVTSEPFAVEKQAKFRPTVILLADYGFNAYSTLIETRIAFAEKKPDLVQRFVDASIVGWYNYIYGNNAPGNALIKKANPEMTDDLLAYSVDKMKEYGIVDSGYTQRWNWRDERRSHGYLFRQDGPCRGNKARHRLSQGLHCGSSTRRWVSTCGRKTDAVDRPACLFLKLMARRADRRWRRCRCAMSPKSMTTARLRGPLDLTIGPESLCRCSGRPVRKSTALRIIAGLSDPTSGHVDVKGAARRMERVTISASYFRSRH
jgi:NitT/TauT family transport system substrate-binding protein